MAPTAAYDEIADWYEQEFLGSQPATGRSAGGSADERPGAIRQLQVPGQPRPHGQQVGAKAPANELGDQPEHRDLHVAAGLHLQLDGPGDLVAHPGDPGVHLRVCQQLGPLRIRPGPAALPAKRRGDPGICPAQHRRCRPVELDHLDRRRCRSTRTKLIGSGHLQVGDRLLDEHRPTMPRSGGPPAAARNAGGAAGAQGRLATPRCRR
jgi:hypothetical protein